MSRVLLALLAASAATPALAQHAGHAEHQHAQPQQPAAGPHAEHVAQPAVDPHAAHREQPAADPHAGHRIAQPGEADPHAGHVMPGHQDAHAGHAAPGQAPAPPAPPVGPPPPAAFSGPEHAADAIFGARQMEPSRRDLIRSHGGMAVSRVRAERLEIGFSDEHESYAWEADFFHGTSLNKLWIKTEGEGEFGEAVEEAEVQALWSRATGPFFDLQAGLRYDIAPDPERAHLVLGLFGTAPYWFEVDAAAFLSHEGELTARLEAEYDLRITQRLILQPLVELDLSAQDIPELGIGAGLSTAEAGLRLRYEIVPEFAPYVGVQYERAFGRTADFRRTEGEDAGSWRFLLGIRTWF